MDKENFILDGTVLEVATYKNYKEATILVSVLDQPDLYGRVIDKESGKKNYKTIIGYPVVAKLKKNNFGGHEKKEVLLSNGKKSTRLDTIAVGSIVDASIEEMEVDGYDGVQNCIIAKCKMWVSRYPEYFKVFDKLWKKGGVKTSWELTATNIIEDGLNKIYKTFEFIGVALLGSDKNPAVPGACVLEYAEYEDFEAELADALEKDISETDIAEANLDIENNKEDKDLAKEKAKEILETPIEDTAEKTEDAVIKEEEKEEATTEKTTEEAEINSEDETNKEEEAEVASLTHHDLFRAIEKECCIAVDGKEWCGFISHWFPEEHTVWFKPYKEESQLDYKLFTYEVNGDEVTISEPTDVTLTVSVKNVNTEIASRDEKIESLTAELELKNEAVISAGEKIGKLKTEVAELTPFKEMVEKAEQEKIEAEIAEEKLTLKSTMLKGGLFTEEEISQAEIAELIEARDKSAINNLIAERYIASLEKEDEVVEETEVTDNASTTATASLETEDEIVENASSFMRAFLTRK